MTGFVQNYVAAENWKTPFGSAIGARFSTATDGRGIAIVVQLLPESRRSYALLGQRGWAIVVCLAFVMYPTTEPAPLRWYQLFERVPKDPWHSDSVYRHPGVRNPSGFDPFSPGPDGIPDTLDDDWGE